MMTMIRLMKNRTFPLLLALFVVGSKQVVQGRAILGVDLGSLYMKVALVQSGSPLEIVTNLHSKRKTEQLILFDNDSRYYGADAAALLARKSHITPAAMSLMLGRDETHPTVQVSDCFCATQTRVLLKLLLCIYIYMDIVLYLLRMLYTHDYPISVTWKSDMLSLLFVWIT